MGYFILGLALGIFIGMLLMETLALEALNEKESLIRASRKALRRAESEITKKNKEIINLENNLELVTSSYEQIKKEAISSNQTTDNFQQNN